MKVYNNILETISKTPMIKIDNLYPDQSVEIFAKFESLNPGGSIKDRICLNMINSAESEGLIDPKKTTIIEPTSGNTGIGLALVCAAKGYKLILTMPEDMSEERRMMLSAYGAEVVLTPKETQMQGSIDKAQELLDSIKFSFSPRQFDNKSNPEIHKKTTALEILQQMDNKIDAFIAGWGNMAGSNIRKFGTDGIGRGTDIKNYWRKDLKLKGTKKINECVKTSPPQYKKAISILTSDFRTFNLEKNMKKCRKLYNPSDCPRIDGGKMEPPFGMEIRIFDHFPSEYLIDLMKIIILLAANSDRHPASTYVYKNPIWIKAIQDIMAYGWNTVLQYSYVVLLRKELGLDLKLKNNDLMAFNLFKTMVDELYAKNKNHRLIYIMDETPHIKPRIPEINRLCWELSFNKKFLKKIINDIKENREKLNITKTNLTLFEFKKLVNGSNSIWRHQMTDLLFALQSKHKVNLKLNNARIEKIKLLF